MLRLGWVAMIARRSIPHSPQLGLSLCSIALIAALLCSSTSAKCLENERKALLKFRQGLVDHSNLLFSWKNHTDCCHWRGVQCNNHNGHVVMLDLYPDIPAILRDVMWKGIDREFGENLKYLRSIDLSSNKLSGAIPESITLLKLQSLNLSRNRLTGSIPENFSPMSNALESLDLSRNELSGRIPESFSSLTSLSKLDLSYNKLTGRIPKSTQLDGFFADPYIGNEGLCGPALNKSCPGDDNKPDQVPDKIEGDANEGGFLSFGFYVSVAVGFVVGFWGACGSLIFQSSWRYSFFALMTRINDQIYIATRLMKARSQRTLRAGW